MPCCKYYGVFWETSIQEVGMNSEGGTKSPLVYDPFVEKNDAGT